jgi:hypothetical protein
LQVFGVTPILSNPRLLLLPRLPVIHPRVALFRVAVVTVPDALIFPARTCNAAGTRVPRKPVSLIVCAFLAVQVSVAVTVEGAPPGTDAGDKEMRRSAGEQLAAAAARVRVYWTACADCIETTSAGTKKTTTATARIKVRVFTRLAHFPLSLARRFLAAGRIARNPIHASRLASALRRNSRWRPGHRRSGCGG